MKSWQIGAVAGLIAGIVKGIIDTIFVIKGLNIGLWYWWLPPYPETSITYIATREITILAIWGILLGVIYSRIYDIIPGRYIKRGMFYGLALLIISNIRSSIISIPYTPNAYEAAIMATFGWISYGLILGILFELLSKHYQIREKLKPKKYDIKSGFSPGAIAGIAFGVVVAFMNVANNMWFYEREFLMTIPDFVNQSIFHIGVNAFFGVLFGAIFAMFYDRVPSKGAIKGLVFGLIIYLISSFLTAVYGGAYSDSALARSTFVSWTLVILAFIVYGLILGHLYRKPPK